MSSVSNRIGGKRARANGEHFEALIERVCFMYDLRGEAYIMKTPEPMKPIKPYSRAGQFIACYTKQAQPDYKGTLKGGRAVVFEAKHTATGRIEQSRVTPEQSAALSKHEALGALCFVLVSFQFKKFYCIPWSVWRTIPETFGKLSVNEKDVSAYEVNISYFLDKYIYTNGDRHK